MGGTTSDLREALQSVPCPLCGGTRFRPRHWILGYAIVDCHGCGLTHVNPQPTDADLARFYETVFHTPAWYERFPHLRDFDYFGEAAGDRAGHRSYVELVRRHVPRGSWLDVGCGHGRLAAEAAAAGYEAFGVDRTRSPSRRPDSAWAPTGSSREGWRRPPSPPTASRS
jgi:hypothetical protein